MNDTCPDQAGKVHKYLATIIMGLALASCSDETSDEALFFPEDRHSSQREIVATAEYDAQVQGVALAVRLSGQNYFARKLSF